MTLFFTRNTAVYRIAHLFILWLIYYRKISTSGPRYCGLITDPNIWYDHIFSNSTELPRDCFGNSENTIEVTAAFKLIDPLNS